MGVTFAQVVASTRLPGFDQHVCLRTHMLLNEKRFLKGFQKVFTRPLKGLFKAFKKAFSKMFKMPSKVILKGNETALKAVEPPL